MSNILKDIIEIASNVAGVNSKKLNQHTRIGKDLQIDGDDVWDLLHKIENIYPLNYNGFDFSKYFTMETEINPIRSLINLLIGRKIQGNETYEVTLGDIENWIKKGYWEEKNNN